jgi:gamma-glutamylcyclotransferase (GGCT)/AIG2-like uncharacterized protein YtfP
MQPYFSYGSNMDAGEMRQRCPGAALQGIAVLPDHRLMITADGFATIVPHHGKRVMGALWHLTESDERSLDDYEDIASGFYRRDFIFVETQGGVVRALVYVASSDRPGKARPGYLELILSAARALGLPPDYVAELEHA